MIAEIRQLLLKPSPENFNKLLELVRDLDADSVEVQYVKSHIESWSSDSEEILLMYQALQSRLTWAHENPDKEVGLWSLWRKANNHDR